MADARIHRRGFLAAAGSTAAGVAGLLTGVHAPAASPPRLDVGPIRQVGPDGAKHIEPWIAANPRDGKTLVVVGSNYLGKAASPSTVRMEPAAWYSVDGGGTWSAGELEGADGLRGERAYFTDAHATHAPDGTAFCAFIGSPKGDRLDLWVYRSDDGGRHWHGPTTLTGGLDYPRLAADLHGGKPRVFVAVAVAGESPIFGETRGRVRVCGPTVGRRRQDVLGGQLPGSHDARTRPDRCPCRPPGWPPADPVHGLPVRPDGRRAPAARHAHPGLHRLVAGRRPMLSTPPRHSATNLLREGYRSTAGGPTQAPAPGPGARRLPTAGVRGRRGCGCRPAPTGRSGRRRRPCPASR